MSAQFKKATREQIKLRMALDGPSGAGKTVTALRLAFGLAAIAASSGKPWRVAVIDTESGSAKKYVGDKWDGTTIDFDAAELAHFAPTEYTSAIEAAGAAGYDALVIDSLSHAWEGKDGALEQVNKKGGNSYTAWRDVTPQHRRMIEAILNSPCHVFATMRSKTDYVLEKDEATGKQVPRKIGMAPIQRQGMEYEFDIYGSIDWAHVMTITKSRCPAVDGAIMVKPGASFLQPIISWLVRGTEPDVKSPRASAMISDAQVQRAYDLVAEMGRKMDWLQAELPKRCGVAELRLVSAGQAVEVMKWLEAQAKGHGKVTAAEQKKAKADAEKNGTEPAVQTPAPTTPAPATTTTAPPAHASPLPPPVQPGPYPLTLEGKFALIRDLYAEWKGLHLEYLGAVAKPPEDPEAEVRKIWLMDIMPVGASKLSELTDAKAALVIQGLQLRIAHFGTVAEIGSAIKGKGVAATTTTKS